MQSITLEPVDRIHGNVRIPGSKSLSNRILLLAAVAEGSTRITNLLESDDIHYMLAALHQLGVCYQLSDDHSICTMHGQGGPLQGEKETLFLGNAGTAMRPLTAVLSAGKGCYSMTGEPRMYERPIGDLVDALAALGADIRYQGNSGYPPLEIRGTGLRAGDVRIAGNISSQFLTALLMAAPLADGEITIHVDGELVSKPYIDITLHVMQVFGVTVENIDYRRFVISGERGYRASKEIMVEGDASSASYFLAAAAIRGGTVKVEGVGSDSVQGDRLFAEVLAAMGADVQCGASWMQATGTGSLKAVDMDMNHIPDAAMTIATTALFAEGTTVIRNIYNWRVKETDRLAAMTTELRKVGAVLKEGNDYIAITPPARLQHAEIDTYNDHRMAMCFSLVALGDTAITINDPGCTAKTFPGYFELFKTICH